jgi:solute carrier family 13 (sodium-dependent dicarboxylate transporter), member 2/3/5
MVSDDFILDVDKIEKKVDKKIEKQIKKAQKQAIKEHVKEFEADVTEQIESTSFTDKEQPFQVIKKTTDLFGKGFHYVVNLEEKFTHDFIFGYLPEKIKKYIKVIIPFSLMLLVLNLPWDVAPDIKKAFALFICISLLWALESLSMIVTALLIPVLAVMLGLIHGTNPFSSFSNPIIYLLLSGLIIAQSFRKHELDKMLAVKVLSMSKGKVKYLLLYTMIIAAVLGMWMSNTATIALLIPVILSISVKITNETEKNYTVMLLLGSGFASAIGGIATILGGNPNAITAAFLSNNRAFEFLDWSIIGFPVSIILFITAYFTFVNIFKIKKEKIKITELTKEAKKIKLTHQQKKILLIFIPTILIWLFGGEVVSFLNLPDDFYRTEVVGLTAAILLFVFNILDWDDVRRIPWEIFLLVGGGLTLGQLLIQTGAASYIATEMIRVMAWMPTPVIIFIFVAMAMVLANFVNNSSTTIILVPVVMQVAEFLDINVKLLAMTVAMATAVSPLTPIAMPAFSLIYGTGYVKRRDMIKTGFKVAIICGPILAGVMSLINWFFF